MNNPCSSILPHSTLKFWYEKGFIVPLVHSISLTSDPWELFLQLKPSEYEFFLDSGKPRKEDCAFSYFGKDPFFVLRKNGNSLCEEAERPTRQSEDRRLLRRAFATARNEGFIEALRKLFKNFKGKTWKELPFFAGGAIGVFGYGLAWEFENLPKRAKKTLPLDDCVLLFVKNLFVYDHTKEKLYFVSNLIPKKGLSFESALQESEKWIQNAKLSLRGAERRSNLGSQILRSAQNDNNHTNGHIYIQKFKPDVPKASFKRIVSRAKKYIRAGDIYQANLAQRFSFRFQGKAEALYSRLRLINPSPFASFIKLKDIFVVSSSPERLVRKRGDHCETRPIAGTRPRGKNRFQNEKLRKELISNPKERAEHLMLVDLERNDLGRVCKPHTIRVSEMMALEEYSHVIHIVSNIEGELAQGKDQFDLLKAMFPGGTITGCPKIRSMEIIEELEPFRRTFYTGSIGHLGFNGDMDLNIIIRTILIQGAQGHFHVGAGIVYDSNPEAEYWETIQKGKALTEALHSR